MGNVSFIFKNLNERSEDDPSNLREIIDSVFFCFTLLDDRTDHSGVRGAMVLTTRRTGMPQSDQLVKAIFFYYVSFTTVRKTVRVGMLWWREQAH
jgi:hypothetical protein